MANRLAGETSPYLLQHRDNPVDWYPWGEEALARAKAEDRPLLVSIGYSACHWCHVMERESFEDERTAALMNEHFVCVKVDREERPDVDATYMEAVQAMTGHGGWPLTAFCDPDGVPFYTGTYFPPEPRGGLPSFTMVCEAVAKAWRSERERVLESTGRLRERLGAIARVEPAEGELSAALLDGAVRKLLASADERWGGFGGAPKFPPAPALELLLGRGELAVVETTLDAMACGGIHDQLGGGFARYSVDERWLVPHFEKMLYDNALLARAYLHGWQATGNERWRTVCERTLEWMLAEMQGPEGGFYAALDADSEGEEGRYYVWAHDELTATLAAAGLADEAGEIAAWWGVTERGNFEGRNVLHLPRGPLAEPPAALEPARAALLARRAERVRPGLDDKRICAWNALAIAALADAGAALGRADFLDAARRCAGFVAERLHDAEGQLLRTWKEGARPIRAYLEDHALLADALLTLYEASFEARWFAAARATADAMVERFADRERGGFFTTAADADPVVARRKDLDDHPLPSGNSAAALALLRLAALTGERSYEEHAIGVLRLFRPVLESQPYAVAHLARALDFHLGPAREVALVAPRGAEDGLPALAAVVRERFRPRTVLAGGVEGDAVPELLRGRTAVEGRAAAYVCERFACRQPVTEPGALAAALSAEE